MGHSHVDSFKTIVIGIACGIALAASLLGFSADEPISLDELNQRASLTEIKPVVIDGKRVVQVSA